VLKVGVVRRQGMITVSIELRVALLSDDILYSGTYGVYYSFFVNVDNLKILYLTKLPHFPLYTYCIFYEETHEVLSLSVESVKKKMQIIL
jgi:hypothetical protein